jgi:hypothetical protein
MMRQSPTCPGPCPGLRRRRGGVWRLGQHQEELPPIRPLVVRVSGKRLAASSVGVRSGVVIRGIRRRRCVRRRPRRVPLHEPRHLVIRHRVLVEETHVAITCAPSASGRGVTSGDGAPGVAWRLDAEEGPGRPLLRHRLVERPPTSSSPAAASSREGSECI